MTKILIGIIRLYKIAISPLLGTNCRFHPTCSEYMMLAIRRHGPLYGSWLGLCRLSHCHPWHPGGEDPVPELKIKNRNE